MDATFKQDSDNHTIEYVDPFPIEDDFDAVARVHNLNFPKSLWHELLHAKVPINNEAQCWKLA